MAPTVSIIGDALLDLTLAPSEPMRPGGDVPATVRLSAGGQGANVAVRLARRGAIARLACALGDDAAGRLVREALEADGVRVDAVPAAATGAVAILLGPRGERTMLSQRVPFLPDVDLARLADDAEWLVISGHTLLEDGALDFARRSAALPPRRAVLGCAVPAARVADWLAAVSVAKPHLVILNTDEARVLVPAERDAEALAAGLALELDALVLVTAAQLAAAAGHDARLTVDAPTGGPAAVDTTGAGDAFAAAVIAGLGSVWPPDQTALRTAMTAGLSVAQEVVGARGAQAPVTGERMAASR